VEPAPDDLEDLDGLEGDGTMGSTRNLIAYFSHSGNTQTMAEQIREIAGGDLFRIMAVDPYPTDYDAVVKVARTEQKKSARPPLSGTMPSPADYDTVFVGYPSWWSTMPMPVFTFLEGLGIEGRRIAPFCTHEGSGLGRSAQDISELCPKAVLLEGLAVRGSAVRTSRQTVQAWLARIGW
jgi:flavodoxin